MIANYSVENFKSFRKKIEFDMRPSKTRVKKRYPDNYVLYNTGIDLLKTAVIVGENAGGKTNFIQSIQFLKQLFIENSVANSLSANVNKGKLFYSNKPKINLFEDSKQTFEIEIVTEDGLIYTYTLIIDWIGIVHERIQYREDYKRKRNTVFECFRKDIKPKKKDDAITVSYSIVAPNIPDNIVKNLEKPIGKNNNFGLFACKLALLGEEHAISLVNWFNNTLVSGGKIGKHGNDRQVDYEHEISILRDERFLNVFKLIDYSICKIKVDEENPYEKSIVTRLDCEGKKFSNEISKDSTGVYEFFKWAVLIYKVVYENKVVLADEMDKVLNPVLSDRIIAFIHAHNHKGQFIFTTHNVLHLNLYNFMKEQIYFITKEKDTLESDLYSLADFSEIRYDTANIYEFYMKGILGGTSFE